MIKVKNISKQFGRKKILEKIEFEIPAGSIIGITGQNGSGKSTLINIMGGLLKPNAGKVLFSKNNELVTINNIKEKIGCVFEKPAYIEKLSGKEFLSFLTYMYGIPTKEGENIVQRKLNYFELDDNTTTLIEKYSNGMKAKISLASALINNPQYLLLDEPFSGIDDHFIKKAMQSVREAANNGASVLIITHNSNVLNTLIDKTYELKNGVIIK